MDENKYNNIYNAMNSNQSYQTYYINNISNNYSNSTITQQQFNFIKDDLIKLPIVEITGFAMSVAFIPEDGAIFS